jgi:hypothetical protein
MSVARERKLAGTFFAPDPPRPLFYASTTSRRRPDQRKARWREELQRLVEGYEERRRWSF